MLGETSLAANSTALANDYIQGLQNDLGRDLYGATVVRVIGNLRVSAPQGATVGGSYPFAFGIMYTDPAVDMTTTNVDFLNGSARTQKDWLYWYANAIHIGGTQAAEAQPRGGAIVDASFDLKVKRRLRSQDDTIRGFWRNQTVGGPTLRFTAVVSMLLYIP